MQTHIFLIYTFALKKKEYMNMKMEEKKIHELWPKLVTDIN